MHKLSRFVNDLSRADSNHTYPDPAAAQINAYQILHEMLLPKGSWITLETRLLTYLRIFCKNSSGYCFEQLPNSPKIFATGFCNFLLNPFITFREKSKKKELTSKCEPILIHLQTKQCIPLYLEEHFTGWLTLELLFSPVTISIFANLHVFVDSIWKILLINNTCGRNSGSWQVCIKLIDKFRQYVYAHFKKDKYVSN